MPTQSEVERLPKRMRPTSRCVQRAVASSVLAHKRKAAVIVSDTLFGMLD